MINVWACRPQNVIYSAPHIGVDELKQAHTAVFIHALVGVFKKKRGTGTWGHGLQILTELLDLVDSSGLTVESKGIYITLLGNVADRFESKTVLAKRNSSKVHIIAESNHSELVEYPALHAMQLYANLTHPRTKLLYMHTKGVRRNGWHVDYPAEWRRYMTFFLVEKYSVCSTALDQRGFESCGVLMNRNIYEGNFWWTTAGWLSKRRPLIKDMVWSQATRYGAEEYILKNVPGKQLLHYCIHHAHHNMQSCSTPRWLYENASLAFRDNPNCYDIKNEPPNKSKDPVSWCHHKKLPEL